MWCPLPWIHQFVSTDAVKTCCNGRVKGPASPVEFYNSDILKNIKEAILDNRIHDNCLTCAKLESQGYTSIRQEAIRDYPYYVPTTVKDKIEYLDLRYNNLCNFSCRTCEPAFSSSIVKEIDKNPILTKHFRLHKQTNSFEAIADEIFDFLPSVKKINFTGGEPLLIKDNIKILEKLIELDNLDCEILITTNASVYNHQWHNLLSKFEKTHWTISIDGVDKSAEYIRNGTDWHTVDSNIRNIVKLGHSVAFNTTVSAYSILNIHRIVEYFLEIEKISAGPFELWFHLCSDPLYLHPGVLQDKLADQAKDSIEQATKLLDKSKYKTNIDFLDNVCNNLNSLEHLYTRFENYTNDLDSVRNQNFQILLER